MIQRLSPPTASSTHQHGCDSRTVSERHRPSNHSRGSFTYLLDQASQRRLIMSLRVLLIISMERRHLRFGIASGPIPMSASQQNVV